MSDDDHRSARVLGEVTTDSHRPDFAATMPASRGRSGGLVTVSPQVGAAMVDLDIETVVRLLDSHAQLGRTPLSICRKDGEALFEALPPQHEPHGDTRPESLDDLVPTGPDLDF